MKIAVFSCFTFSYLNRARVLFASVARHHPDWQRIALIVDTPPPGFTFDPAREPFDRVVTASEAGLDDRWLFSHDLIEACTGAKAALATQLCQRGAADAIVYLDPDICVFEPLGPVVRALEHHDIVLTPHQIDPDDTLMSINDNERTSLRTGVFNLGFVAMRTTGEGRRFAEWWHARVRDFCHDDLANGLFVDQKWCDLVPGLFDRVGVLRDPGCNVASWNLSQRRVAFRLDGRAYVNGEPLRFFHFTKLGPVGETMTRRYAGASFAVHELWNWYVREVERQTDGAIPAAYWRYATFEDGTVIAKADRVRYRNRPDLQAAFAQPFASGDGTFQRWLSDPSSS